MTGKELTQAIEESLKSKNISKAQIPSKQIQEWGGWKDDVILNKIYIKLSTATRTESKDKFTKFFENKKSAEE